MSDDNPRAIRLVYYDEERKRFLMDPEAVSILERLEGPIAAVSVCGWTQNGKSFLMNQLLGRTSGFQLGNRPRSRCTRGLWMWSTPSTQPAADGTEYNVLVIDSQGIDNFSKHVDQYNYLALVLSSMLIYNEASMITLTSFGVLTYLTALTDTVVDDTTSSELEQFSPIFVWLMRDIDLGGNISPKEYMESALKPVDITCESLQYVNKCKKSLQAVFPNRECFTLVRPVIKDKDLGVLDQTMDPLTPEFRKGMEKIKSFVFKKTKPKKIGETVMTGPIFLQTTRYMLEAFNKGTLPMMSHIWVDVEENNRSNAWKSATTPTILSSQPFEFFSPPAANTRQRRRSIKQIKDVSHELASIRNA